MRTWRVFAEPVTIIIAMQNNYCIGNNVGTGSIGRFGDKFSAHLNVIGHLFTQHQSFTLPTFCAIWCIIPEKCLHIGSWIMMMQVCIYIVCKQIIYSKATSAICDHAYMLDAPTHMQKRFLSKTSIDILATI